MDQFWHVLYPVASTDTAGRTNYGIMFALCGSEAHARALASMYSRGHGYANVANRDGLVATYVGGSLRVPSES